MKKWANTYPKETFKIDLITHFSPNFFEYGYDFLVSKLSSESLEFGH